MVACLASEFVQGFIVDINSVGLLIVGFCDQSEATDEGELTV